MRTFIAAEIDHVVRDQLARLQEEMKAAGALARWVAPENIHLTLKFLGQTPDQLLSEVSDIIRRCCADAPAFAMRVGGVGAFPTVSRPRVVFVGLQAPEALYQLQERLEEALAPLGYDREKRRFKPHLTLGRVKRNEQSGRLPSLIGEMAEKRFGETEVTELVFMMSELSPRGPRYTPLYRAPLAG